MSNYFPIFNPSTERCIGYRCREEVHANGDWHYGVQANVIRKNEKSFDILLQRRSTNVDISKGALDQSLATQMVAEDNLDDEVTLRRGLRCELGIGEYQIRRVPGRRLIVKTYDNPRLLNREILSLFIVLIASPTKLVVDEKRVDSVNWMPWEDFLVYFQENKKSFTKTSQFYFSVPWIRDDILVSSMSLLNTGQSYQKMESPSSKLTLRIDRFGQDVLTLRVPFRN